MPRPKTESELVELFRALRASRPEEWVSYVLSDPEPQLAKYVFLKQAWQRILEEGETAWIDEQIDQSKKHPQGPYAGVGLALQRVLAAGASKNDISEIARGLQAQMLFMIGYLIDGPAYPEPGLEEIDWGLYRRDDEGAPIGEPIVGLYESVLETDPTGREMRPRD